MLPTGLLLRVGPGIELREPIAAGRELRPVAGADGETGDDEHGDQAGTCPGFSAAGAPYSCSASPASQALEVVSPVVGGIADVVPRIVWRHSPKRLLYHKEVVYDLHGVRAVVHPRRGLVLEAVVAESVG
jgi:hypothetical protein